MTAPAFIWPGVGFPGGYGRDWFAMALARAQHLLPGAKFDTVIGDDFGNTVTSAVVDVAGSASAFADGNSRGGVVTLSVGDAVITSNLGRLSPTGAGSHVKAINNESWYAAGLVKITQPLDETQLADTRADVVGLWTDANNFVAIGIKGNGSGGSSTKWVGCACVAASLLCKTGPDLDPEESPVWHVGEMWFDADTAELHFAIDGVEFVDVIDASDMPGTPGTLAIVGERNDAGDPALINVDKYCVAVPAQKPGEI